jgi:hypothetical protein
LAVGAEEVVSRSEHQCKLTLVSHAKEKPMLKQPLNTGTQKQAQIDNDSPMQDAQAMQDQGPDFSFTRTVYINAPSPTPGRKNFFRCTWRVNIPKNTSPEEGVKDAILEIWSALKDANRRLLIYPWHQSAYGLYKALLDTSKLPKKKETLIRYFKDAHFRPHPGPMYIRVNFFWV